jgi:hypothetical protein
MEELSIKENVEFQFKSSRLVNRIGSLLLFGCACFMGWTYFSMWFVDAENDIIVFSVIGFLLLLIFGLSMLEYRSFSKGKLHFIPEGVIIESKVGYIPIKYDEIKYFKNIRIKEEDGRQEFLIEKLDGKKYRIKARSEVYQGLIQFFAKKDGTHIVSPFRG